MARTRAAASRENGKKCDVVAKELPVSSSSKIGQKRKRKSQGQPDKATGRTRAGQRRQHLDNVPFPNDLPLYEYPPLAHQDEIRVITLCGTKERIECRIDHVSLRKAKFQALSYVWGDTNQQYSAIAVDKFDRPIGRIPLTENLHNAMCDLRDATELTRKVFWIDQLCINQQDEKEKNHQVSMMRKIYKSASQVVTYVGPAGSTREEENGAALLEKFYTNISEDIFMVIYQTKYIDNLRDKVWEGKIKLSGLPQELDLTGYETDEEVQMNFYNLGLRWIFGTICGEWVRRLWIVQEQLLNPELVILHGQRLLNWDAVAIIPILFYVNLLPRQYFNLALYEDFEIGADLNLRAHTLHQIWLRRNRGDDWQQPSLLHNINAFAALSCKDLRDRIYALLSISQDADELGIEPEYSEANTHANVAVTVSSSIFNRGEDLKMLVEVCGWRLPNSALPSWSITLDRPSDATPSECIPYSTWSAHPKSRIDTHGSPRIKNTVLVLKGRVLDHVSFASASVRWHKGHFHGICDKRTIEPYAEYLASLTNLFSGELTIDDVVSVCRSLAPSSRWSLPLHDTSSPAESTAFHFWAFYRLSIYFLRKEADEFGVDITELMERFKSLIMGLRRLIPGMTHNDFEPLEIPNEQEEHSYWAIISRYLRHGRSMSRTKSGRPCNAMHDVEAGDAIAAFQGSDRLWVLRSVGNQYKLIGDAYVDGLMDGEAYEGLDPDEVDYEIEII